MRMSDRNAEGYADPTARSAIDKTAREEDRADARARAFIRAIYTLAGQSGYYLPGGIDIIDRRTGRRYH